MNKQYLSYILICSFDILYNSKFILIAMSLGTNVVVVTRIHCISEDTQEIPQSRSIAVKRRRDEEQ